MVCINVYVMADMDEMFNGGDFAICPQGKLLAGFDSNVLSIHLDLPLD
jgi:hypothetical protein